MEEVEGSGGLIRVPNAHLSYQEVSNQCLKLKNPSESSTLNYIGNYQKK